MIINLIFIAVLIICFITDIREQKIYNVVILPSILTVIILNVFYTGLAGLKFSLFGLLIGAGILLIPYLIGGMGAGDVKLLAFVGAAKGTIFVINAAMYMALIGGAIALIILLSKRQVFNFFKSIYYGVFSIVYAGKKKIDFETSGISNKFPYGTAIVAGALICMFFKGAWII